MTKRYVLLKQMMPYCGFFIAYLIYSIFIFKHDMSYIDNESGEQTEVEVPMWFNILDNFWLFVLLIYSFYFLRLEYRQVQRKGWDYLKDVWNYADFGPPILIILIVIADIFFSSKGGEGLQTFRFSVQALASFGMWIKILYFLRIFRQTGFFVNMLFRITRRSSIFFMIYMLILAAFGCSFYIMSATEGQGIFFYFNYSYLLGLGEFDMEWDGYHTPAFMHFAFLAATLIVQIVMLNLLIALVSAAYEEVTET